MKKLCLLFMTVSAVLPLMALRCGDKAAELPNLKYFNGQRRPVALPGRKGTLRVLTFLHVHANGTAGTVRMLSTLARLHGSKVELTVITPDPESDAALLKGYFRQSQAAFAVDSGRRITMQYMAGSLLYPRSFVIDADSKIIWCGETVDLGEMLQTFFAGNFDREGAAKICPMLDELQTLLRESSERKMKQLTDRIFAIDPAHPAALRMRLFALENSRRIPQAWQLLRERLKAAPGIARLYFTAVDFISRYPYFQSSLKMLLEDFERHIKEREPGIMMATELLKRFKYDLTALEYADRLAGAAEPSQKELRQVWFALRAMIAYLAGDTGKAVSWQKKASAGRRGPDRMLEYFTGAAAIRKRLP
jgi:hypothetical protein